MVSVIMSGVMLMMKSVVMLAVVSVKVFLPDIPLQNVSRTSSLKSYSVCVQILKWQSDISTYRAARAFKILIFQRLILT